MFWMACYLALCQGYAVIACLGWLTYGFVDAHVAIAHRACGISKCSKKARIFLGHEQVLSGRRTYDSFEGARVSLLAHCDCIDLRATRSSIHCC